MKVIFLDIDGVLNTEICVRHFFDIVSRGTKIDCHDEFGVFFDSVAVDWLLYIINETGAEIVISSTWKYNGLDSLVSMWKKRKLPGHIIGITPTVKADKNLSFQEREERGNEILMYLDSHPEIESYVIIDDDDDMLEYQKPFFVQTNPLYGITAKEAGEAIRILNDK